MYYSDGLLVFQARPNSIQITACETLQYATRILFFSADMNSEDSDATVAEEPLSGCYSDTEPEAGKSPSILSLAPKLPDRESE